MALTKITGDGYGAGTITTADNTDQLILKSTDADASVGPVLRMNRDSGSPADNDVTGGIIFNADDGAGNSTEFVSILTQSQTVANGSEDGRFQMSVMKAGTARNVLDFTNTGVVFNEDSQDLDFRVESDSQMASFFVEGSSSNIGIGHNTPTADSSLAGVSVPAGTKYVHVHDGDGAVLKLSDPSDGSNRGAQFAIIGTDAILNNCEGGNFKFGNGNTLAMTLNSSRTLGIGKTPDSSLATVGTEIHQDGTVLMSRNSSPTLFINRSDDGTVIQIFRGASTVGTISVTSSNTAYNTSSDYRLKENVDYTWDATTRLKQLKPARFNFIADDTNTLVDGFIAHEVSGIVPEAITGEKDAVETWTSDEVDNGDAPDGVSAGANKLDADGNTIPVMQGIDQSKLVPLLVKTIQELEARITALESA